MQRSGVNSAQPKVGCGLPAFGEIRGWVDEGLSGSTNPAQEFVRVANAVALVEESKLSSIKLFGLLS